MTERIPPRSSRARALAAVLAFGLAANTAWSAGLGRLTVRSSLGQPLRAEVEIASLTRDEAASISARLASPEAFRQAGLELTPAVAGLRFSIDRRDDGRAVVIVSSTQPISEPFLDLVIELSWANGRFVRGYTFLLDPPELRAGRREVVEGAAVQPSPAPLRAIVAAEPASPVPSPAAATRTPPREPKSPPAHSPGDRIPVGAGVTLRSIAGRVRPEGVTLEQAQVALYRANPSAFLGSIHGLRADATLVVPDRAAMLAVDPAQARAEALGAVPSVPADRPRSAEAVKPPAPAPAGQTADAAIATKPGERVAPPRDRLKLSGPQSAAGSAPAAPDARASVGTAAPERAAGRDVQLGEFQARISEIEKSISEMQRLLESKNRALAELQKQVEAVRAAARPVAGASEPRPPASSAASLPAAPASQPVTTSAAAAPLQSPTTPGTPPISVQPESAQPDAAAAGTGAPSTPGQAPQSAAQQAQDAADPSTTPAPTPAPPPPSPPPAVPTNQPGFVADLLQQPFTLPGFGAVALLVVGYAWYAIRRRRRIEHFEDSLVSADGLAANSLFGATGGQSVDTGDDTFGRGSGGTSVDIHAAEVDPIAEAEVYIAYGREAQAEEILREALLRQPERQALRAKLMEIHAGRHDAAAFGQLAEEMFAATGGRNEEWPRLVAMGAALDPAHPLFAGQGARQEAEPEVGERLDAILSSAPAIPGGGPNRPVVEPEPAVPPEPMIDFGPIPRRVGGRQGAEPVEGSKVDAAVGEPVAPDAPPVVAVRGEQPAPPVSGLAPASDQLSGPDVSKPVPEMAPLEFAPLEFDLGLPGRKVASSPSAAPVPVPASGPADRIEPPVPLPELALELPDLTPAATEVPSSARSELEKAIDGRFELPSLDLAGVPELPATVEKEPSEGSAGPPQASFTPMGGGLGEARPWGPSEGSAGPPQASFIPMGGGLGEARPWGPSADSPAADFSTMRFDLEPAAVIETAEDARGHDLATRLDLAAAFAEIGDKAGARELLEQVLEEGDAKLRERARSMLDALG